MKKYKLAVLTSHPIQYQAPLFKKLAARPDVDLTVYFCWDFGVREAEMDKELGMKVKWDVPLLGGYQCKFLKNLSLKPANSFCGQINPGIVPELIKAKPHAILIFGWNSFTNWLAFLIAFVSGIPVFLRGESPLSQEFLKNPLKLKIKKIILGTLFKRIRAFLYFGKENKKFFQYYGVPEEKLFFCPYADDNEYYIAAAKNLESRRNEFRNELGISPEKTVILFVGKFIDKKRPFDLLEAYEKIRHLNAALVLVGDGPLRQEAGIYAKNRNLSNVHFVGFKNLTELPKYYALSDILVLPSASGETWGLVVNIAMCFKLPVIVSDLVGCGPDLVKDGLNGYVFPLGNTEKLSRQIEDLIKNPRKRKEFGRKSFEIVQDYSFDKDIEGILAAFAK